VLLDELNAASGIKFSKHAAMRLEQRNIALSPEDIGKIRETVEKASSKGLKESLFVMHDVSLLVNIENRTVVTAMTNNDTKDGFVTNIDSVALFLVHGPQSTSTVFDRCLRITAYAVDRITVYTVDCRQWTVDQLLLVRTNGLALEEEALIRQPPKTEAAAAAKRRINAMMRSMFSGVSGLRNHQTRMDVIGNNIANVNTNGYKSSRVTFQDMLSQTLKSGTAPNTTGTGGSNPSQVGLGMVVGSIDTLQTQGNLQSTGKSTDMALQGDGFFVLSNDNGSTYRYSRDGAFDLNQNGDLVNAANGYKVQGWSAENGSINTTAAVGPITIRIGAGMVAKATENVSLSGNLNAEGDTATTGTVTSTTTALYSAAGVAAVGTTALQSLTDVAGTNLGVGSSITINGRKNGVDLDPVTLSVTATTTVNDLMDAIERAYGIYDDSATVATEGVSLAAGLITVSGNLGTVNALTGINIDLRCHGFQHGDGYVHGTAAADGESMTATLVAYDSLGTSHEVNVCFTKTDSNEWTWNADLRRSGCVIRLAYR
jgi:flagellar operon protein